MAGLKAVVDWIAVEGAYRAGKLSLREMAEEFYTSEGNIRRIAKKKGWLRDSTGTKRLMVADALSGNALSGNATSGNATHRATQYALRSIEQEAAIDVADMASGLEVARGCIRRLQTLIEQVVEPKDIKIIAESNRIAIETIRRIRGLDDPAQQSQNTVVGFRVEVA